MLEPHYYSMSRSLYPFSGGWSSPSLARLRLVRVLSNALKCLVMVEKEKFGRLCSPFSVDPSIWRWAGWVRTVVLTIDHGS
jgi:hypothetical protein